eukprot:Em0002g706a
MVLWLEVVLHLIMFTLELGASTVLRINLSTCDHGNADVLSRLPVGPDISFDEDEDVADVDTVCTIKTGSRVIIPSILRPQVLQLLHLGHFGIQRMKQLARTAVYWPRIDADIMDLFHQCTASAEHQNKPPKLANHPWMLPEKPWSRVHVDHAIIFLGCNWLVLIDAYSKYPSIHPTTSTSTKSTTELLEQDLLICAYCTGTQAQAATKSQECELPNKVAVTYNVGSPCYALYYGPRGEKDPRWVLAVVTKRFGTCSVNVRVFPRGGTWRRHVEQLRPRYVDQEDTDPGPVQIQTMEPVVSLQEATLLADGAPTPAMAQMPVLVPPPVGKAQNPRLPTGNEYSTHNPRRSSRRPISRKPEHNTTLSKLWLDECGLRDEAISELCGGLKWCRLKLLDLYGNPFGDQGAKGLADVLKDHPTLEELRVWECIEMSDDGVQHLMDAMMSNTRVKKLVLPSKYNGLTVPKELVGRIQFS